jgi:hypothetical protein
MSKDFYIKAIAGGGDMLKSVYDTDVDGVVDSAERIQIVVRNSTGSTLTKGQIVYLSGATGNRPNAVLAQANSEATSSKTIGMVIANIANNTDGQIAVNGTLHDIDTSAFSAGDMLWLSATTAGGVVANTPPAEPNHSVFIGYVARVHPTLGRVVLAIQNGYELDELHGVQITSVANNDLLQYDSTSGLWKNESLSSAGIQPTLVSGTSIKTINSTSLLGSGNVAVEPTITAGTTLQYFRGDKTFQTLPIQNIQSITDGTAVTGTTASTLTASILIPANTIAVGDVIYVKTRIRKTGVLGTVTTRMYVNTSSAIGGSLIATSASAAATTLMFQYTRSLAVKTSTNTETMAGNLNVNADDNTAVTTAVSANNIDWTQNQYLVVAVQNGSTSDSSRSSFIQVQINKA